MSDRAGKPKDPLASEGRGKGESDQETANRDREMTEIDYLYDEYATHGFAGTEIDYLYDELFGGDAKNITHQAVLEFLDGRREEVARVELFQPGAHEITAILEDGVTKSAFTLSLFRSVRAATMPPQFPDLGDSSQVETVETVDGKSYEVFVPPAQSFGSGIFAFSTEVQSQCKYIFFPFTSIKQRYQKRYLGEILIERGAIKSIDFQQALKEFQQLKNLKIGQIIAKKENIRYASIDQEIQKAYKAERKGIKAGEILLEAGLIDKEQLEAALIIQDKLKKQKIGQFLIEKGILHEEEVFSALAEKFRMEFVDLRKVSLSKNTLSMVPKELILKYKVLPLSFNDRILTVATMVPDAPVLKEIIAKYSKQEKIRFVLARPSHLNAVIRQLHQQGA